MCSNEASNSYRSMNLAEHIIRVQDIGVKVNLDRPYDLTRLFELDDTRSKDTSYHTSAN